MPRLPFIENMNENVRGLEACTLKITKNGKYVTQNLDKVVVDVAGMVPTGTITITSTTPVDVTKYATAQVTDTNLLAENIKKDVAVLGVVGTFAGGSGDLDELMQESF